MSDKLLEVRNVTKVFGRGMFRRNETVALEDFSLTIDAHPPTVTTIAGESGSGKTTLARLVLGFIQPTAGEILYKGQPLHKMSPDAYKDFRREVQAIFQDPFEVYNPFYPVDRVLLTPVRAFGLAKDKDEALHQACEALERVGLRPDETLGRYPHQLSGGQRQRIIVARTLLLRPRLIVADEPVSMIDASLRATILDNLRQLRDELNISLLYITHDLATAYQLSDRIYILYRGIVTETGNADRVIRAPQHPYSQLLVSSIPVPDPDLSWDEIPLPANDSQNTVDRHGCLFHSRCPHVMPQCKAKRPPLFKIADDQAASCFLYDDGAAITQQQATKLATT